MRRTAIVKKHPERGVWCLFDSDGKKALNCFDNRYKDKKPPKGAIERAERIVQFYKHRGSIRRVAEAYLTRTAARLPEIHRWTRNIAYLFPLSDGGKKVLSLAFSKGRKLVGWLPGRMEAPVDAHEVEGIVSLSVLRSSVELTPQIQSDIRDAVAMVFAEEEDDILEDPETFAEQFGPRERLDILIRALRDFPKVLQRGGKVNPKYQQWWDFAEKALTEEIQAYWPFYKAASVERLRRSQSNVHYTFALETASSPIILGFSKARKLIAWARNEHSIPPNAIQVTAGEVKIRVSKVLGGVAELSADLKKWIEGGVGSKLYDVNKETWLGSDDPFVKKRLTPAMVDEIVLKALEEVYSPYGSDFDPEMDIPKGALARSANRDPRFALYYDYGREQVRRQIGEYEHLHL